MTSPSIEAMRFPPMPSGTAAPPAKLGAAARPRQQLLTPGPGHGADKCHPVPTTSAAGLLLRRRPPKIRKSSFKRKDTRAIK